MRCVGTHRQFIKKNAKKFVSFQKKPYLCHRYPENNLFTLEN